MTATRRRGRRAAACIIAAAGLVGLVPWGIKASARQPKPAETAPPSAATLTNERAARELVRMGTLDLQITGGSAARDYRLASILLEIAYEILPKIKPGEKARPENEEILRLLIDAVSSSGDREKLQQYTRELVELNRDDTVAQLRLFSGRISELQDVDSRLKAYETLLGAGGDKLKLDGSVRSRLALDAALLLRERGDIRGFADKLSQATALDPTNKDAASLAASFFSEQSDDAAGRLLLLINLLKADPFDPDTILAIARELAAGEAFDQSYRFYGLHGSLVKARGEEVVSAIAAESYTVFWCRQGAEKTLTQIRAQVEEQKTYAKNMREYVITHDLPADQAPNPDKVRLAVDMERVRCASALASGDLGQIDYAFSEMVRTFQLNIDELSDKTKLPPGTSETELQDRVRRLKGELMWMRLWCGRQLDEAAAVLDEAKQDPNVNPAVLDRLTGWLLLQRGELDKAEGLLTALAPTDELARLGLCVIKERRGPAADAAAAYTEFAHRHAGTVAGTFARTRAQVLSGKPVPPLSLAEEMTALAETNVKSWLEELIADPRKMMSLQVNPEYQQVGPMEPIRVRVRLRNTSPIALAVGSERPLNSQILLVPELKVAMDRVAESSRGATVVRLDRKLRLLPQEEIDVMLWADAASLGWIMSHMITETAVVRWKALQGFRYNRGGYYFAGPLCLTTDTGPVQRSASAKTFDDGETIARWIETGTTEDIAECLALAQIIAPLPEKVSRWKPEDKDRIAAALATRYPKLDRDARLMVAAMLPLKQLGPWLKPVEDAVNADADLKVKTVALILRVSDASDPVLAAAEASGDARLAEAAVLVKDRLSDGTKTYSTMQTPKPGDGGDAAAAPPPTTPTPTK